MIIRQAQAGDIKQWSVMRTALWPNTSDAHLGELEAYFEGVSIDIDQAFVVEVDALVVGFIELNLRNFAEGSRHSKVPYVEGWYVKPVYQAQGIGRMLMERAERWALEQGCSELASDTEIDNHKSIAMHKHLGFRETERVVCFLKQLD